MSIGLALELVLGIIVGNIVIEMFSKQPQRSRATERIFFMMVGLVLFIINNCFGQSTARAGVATILGIVVGGFLFELSSEQRQWWWAIKCTILTVLPVVACMLVVTT